MRRLMRVCLILTLSLAATGCASLHGARTEESFSWTKVRGWLHLPESESDEDSTSSNSLDPAQPTGHGGSSRHWQTGMAP